MNRLIVESFRRFNLTTFGGGRKKIYMCKNVKQNVLFEQSEFTFCSFCMCNYFMFFLVTRHSQVNLPLRSLLEKIPTGNQVGR